jgi:hypothetical protein
MDRASAAFDSRSETAPLTILVSRLSNATMPGAISVLTDVFGNVVKDILA